MTTTAQQLSSQRDALAATADAAYDATRNLARAANGNRYHILPGPTCHTLLGGIKGNLWHLTEVLEFMPTGLNNSLNHDQITIYDHDATGATRDPHAQAALAADHLRAALTALQQATASIELAQSALGGQGWDEK